MPSIALSWKANRQTVVFVRYQEGFRPGGLSVAGTASGLAVSRFKGDNVGTWEAGLRLGDDARRFQLAATASFTRWENIQADLIDSAGLPFTANIGTGRVIAFDVNATWRPLAGLSIEAALFTNGSDLSRPAAQFADARGAELPNVAELGGYGRAAYHHQIDGRFGLDLGMSARYVGQSRLGIGPPLDIPQGRYVEMGIDTRLGLGRFGLSADISNLLNSSANRFSFGNPFSVDNGLQITPLRPRTIRFGVDARF